MGAYPIEMCWLDVETTGLDANEDVPLEIGIVLTDKHGHYVDEAQKLVWEEHSKTFLRGVGRGVENKFVDEMHTKSGLWDDLATKQNWSRSFVDQYLTEWLKALHVEPQGLDMAGNSIGSLDRPFVIQHFPKLNSFLNYRNIDMSSLKQLCKMHRPRLYDRMVDELGDKSDATHRVLDDCKASIKEYQFYLEHFLVLPAQ